MRLTEVCRVHGEGDTAVHALRGVSHEFAAGSFTAIMGPSGSGKSTLLHCASGLDTPTSGTVQLDGLELSALDERARTELRRDRIGFVFQAFNLVASLTAEQNVLLPLRLAGQRPPATLAAELLAEVGLGGLGQRRPGQLSGGQQQRVAIARALAARPAVLFADEPTGALDTTTARAVLDLFRATIDTHRQTTVMVTHDPVAASAADRVLVLADGRVVDVLTDPTPALVADRLAGLGVDPVGSEA
ncbi:ABC transporter ATP-binding protein [Actinophytocola xinjiangensis]|uniref:ABC transporter ATP-binding protein n=1 Tax=Actinophytocola xinjiangensis TaxID=485602 RepID=UPI001B80AF57|nr:ABC transporter ATP-binding protein [Actinophytocola xinjiangensis]